MRVFPSVLASATCVAAVLVAPAFVAIAAGACTTTTTTVAEPDSPNGLASSTASPIASATPAVTATATATASASLLPTGSGDEWTKPNANGKANGDACTKPDDCKSGVCEGEGCTTGPRCVDANRMCTRDLVFYCGCDGSRFSGSGSCAGRPYKNKGACK